MPAAQRVALECEITRGGFSDERIFKILLPSGEYTSLASRQYCWDDNDEPLQEDQPAAGRTIRGKVAARVIEVNDTGVLVSVPDGEAITVAAAQLLERPAKVGAHVSV